VIIASRATSKRASDIGAAASKMRMSKQNAAWQICGIIAKHNAAARNTREEAAIMAQHQ